MPRYILTAALSWFQAAFTSTQHSRGHETANKSAYTIHKCLVRQSWWQATSSLCKRSQSPTTLPLTMGTASPLSSEPFVAVR